VGGSWIMDGGQGQFKAICSYAPLGSGMFTAIAFSGINFDWTLDGLKPTATHGTTLVGVVKTDENECSFILVGFALDDSAQAIYILKATGKNNVVDQDTLNMNNLVFHFYNNPETANPMTDPADFCIPHMGTFPPVRQYRIKFT
jgi:hypothetical protein